MILSKSLRKQAGQLGELLEATAITWQALPLTQERFLEWQQFYEQRMLAQDHRVIAQPEWFSTVGTKKQQLWLLEFKQGADAVGGAVVSRDDVDTITQHFKASDRIDISNHSNTSLGSLMELCFLQFAHDQQPRLVSSGRSRNAFGFHNTLGYLTSKLRMGYRPEPAPGFEHDHTFERHSDTTPTAWLVLNEQKTIVLLLSPSPDYFDGELLTYAQRAEIPVLSWNTVYTRPI